MAHRTLKSLLAIGFMLLPASADGQQGATREGSKVLEGRWQVELYLDPRSMRSPPPAEKVSGEIAFGTESWWGNAERFGRYAVDLRPFFGRFFAAPSNVTAFSAADTSFLTEASGGVAGDSVVIDFMPRVDHLGLTFRGRFYGDSARGRWYRRGTEGYGPFVLKRVSSAPVAVAAVPDPAKQTAAPAQAVARSGRRTAARRETAQKPPAKPAPTTTAAAKEPLRPAAKDAPKVAAAQPQQPATNAPATNVPATNVPATSAPGREARTAAAAPNAPVAGGGTAQTLAPAPRPEAPRTTGAASTTQAAARSTSPSPPATTPANTPARTVATTTTNTPAPTSAPAAAPAASRPQGVLIAVTSSPLVAAAARARGDTAGTGALRVRIFDRASQRWFATKYALKLPDGNWMLANLRTGSGADGWGTPIRRAPGRHEVEIGDFVCGDKIWFLRNKIARAVEVKAGETTDVSIDVDLTAEAAKPSLDNRSGAKCSAPPGAPR